MHIRRRILHGLYTHNLKGLLLRVVHHLRRTRSRGVPEPEQAHPFDKAEMTETSGFIAGEHLRTGTAADLYNTAYYAISPSTLKAALALVPAELDGYTFIDLGCGKGRALLVANLFPFKRVIGVEISPELCHQARANVGRHPRISIVEQDAANFVYPAGPLLIYFYNPFLRPFLKSVLKNIQRQWQKEPRQVFVLSAFPAYPKLMSRLPFLIPVWNRFISLSAEDASADRHGITQEHYALYRTP